ncbi:trypsin-like [Gracilinanus agilis]|uniref:trypsin-like n=1 Tax=Gracilinanus agilis TaxID=191870 RepID=UPI001CFF0EF5|nr:trypsin-like [Gracilinanus agilis]
MKSIVLLFFLGATVAFSNKNYEKIIGGNDCEKNSVPYQVYVRAANTVCGGSLINAQWVLSAAHCYQSKFQMILGAHALNVLEGNEQIINSTKVIRHPSYQEGNPDHDIMLIKLQKAATLNSHVAKISLPTSCVTAGTDCLISGWGIYQISDSKYSSILQCLYAPVLSEKICHIAYPGMITENMICLGFMEGKKDTCQGDSGGPVVCEDQLQGIVSWGLGCAKKGKPGVYTKVCNYVDWIKKTIADN